MNFLYNILKHFVLSPLFQTSNIFLMISQMVCFIEEYDETVLIKCVDTYYVGNLYDIMESQLNTGNLL